MPKRFIEAIEAAAMRAGAASTDEYLADWRRGDPLPCGDDLEVEAGAAAAGLETEYDQTRLMALARNVGRESPP